MWSQDPRQGLSEAFIRQTSCEIMLHSAKSNLVWPHKCFEWLCQEPTIRLSPCIVESYLLRFMIACCYHTCRLWKPSFLKGLHMVFDKNSVVPRCAFSKSYKSHMLNIWEQRRWSLLFLFNITKASRCVGGERHDMDIRAGTQPSPHKCGYKHTDDGCKVEDKWALGPCSNRAYWVGLSTFVHFTHSSPFMFAGLLDKSVTNTRSGK